VRSTMATIGIDYLLEGPDSSDEDNQPIESLGNLIEPVHADPADAEEPSAPAEPSAPDAEPSEPESKEPELSGMDLLKDMYQKDEQRRASQIPSAHKKVKLKIKKGTKVDIFSASKDQWLEGEITEIKGDTLCVQYGKKMKWLKTNSKHLKFRRALLDDKEQSAEPSPQPPPPDHEPEAELLAPAAFSGMGAMSVQVSYDVPEHALNGAPSKLAPAPPNAPAQRRHSAQPLSMRKALQPQQQQQPRRLSAAAAENIFIYDVTFESNSLGVSLVPFKDGRNCLVRECLGVFAQSKIDPGSMVCAVNGANVLNKSYDEIHEALRAALRTPPVRVTFRARTDGNNYKQQNNVNERGTLYVKVVAGMQLKHAARYATVQVGKALLKTKELPKADQHPQFDDTLVFKNFRCDHGKKAMVRVYSKKTLKDKEVGHVEYDLPVKFGVEQKDTLDIVNDKNKLHGVILLHTFVKRN